jgi:hypothetical protein
VVLLILELLLLLLKHRQRLAATRVLLMGLWAPLAPIVGVIAGVTVLFAFLGGSMLIFV